MMFQQGLLARNTDQEEAENDKFQTLSYQTRLHRDAQLWLQISTRCHMEDTQLCLGREKEKQEL